MLFLINWMPLLIGLAAQGLSQHYMACQRLHFQIRCVNWLSLENSAMKKMPYVSARSTFLIHNPTNWSNFDSTHSGDCCEVHKMDASKLYFSAFRSRDSEHKVHTILNDNADGLIKFQSLLFLILTDST